MTAVPVEQAVRGFFMTISGRSALVAFSGGPDSCALLVACARLRQRLGLELAACWVDHRLRSDEELGREETLVRQICEHLSVRLEIRRAAPGQLLGQARGRADGGVEAAAREFRYAALEACRKQLGLSCVLTAHNADDQLETVLMRFLGGSGSAGLRGIPAWNPPLGRPLLSLHKQDLLSYLRELKLIPSHDSTNDSCDYLRNAVRHKLVPCVLEVFPHVREALNTGMEKMSLDDAALEYYAQALLFEDEAGPGLSLDRFRAAPAAVRLRALYRLCRKGRSRLPWPFMKAAVFADLVPGVLAEGHGISIYCTPDAIRMRLSGTVACSGGLKPVGGRNTSAKSDFGFAVLLHGDFYGEVLPGYLLCASHGRPADMTVGIRTDGFRWPLLVRTRQPGDSLCFAGGHKKIDSLLKERRLPVDGRALTLIVEDCHGVVAVLSPGLPGGACFRYNEALAGTTAPAFFCIALKGVQSNHAI